jgi:hypothetical protein
LTSYITPKAGGAEITMEDGHGASALISAVRAARTLNVMSESEATTAGVASRRTDFKVDEGKANLAPPPEAGTWYRIESTALGNASPINPDDGDRVGVVTSWKWPDHLEGITGADFNKVARTIRAAIRPLHG